jgi:hypothetical protein
VEAPSIGWLHNITMFEPFASISRDNSTMPSSETARGPPLKKLRGFGDQNFLFHTSTNAKLAT